MTTWTLEQVRQVRSLRAEVVIDRDLADRYGDDLLSEVQVEMAKRITEMAHPFGVEVDPTCPADFEVVWEIDPARPWEAKGRLRWSPSTNTVELRGGNLDGQRYAVQRVGDPFRVARPTMTPWFDKDADATSAALVEMADVYELAGWREDEHVWVYTTH